MDALIASFVRVAALGFQTKNVSGSHYKMAFTTSWLIAVSELVVVKSFATDGWASLPAVGLGGAIGIIFSMWLHDRWFKRPSTRASGESLCKVCHQPYRLHPHDPTRTL